MARAPLCHAPRVTRVDPTHLDQTHDLAGLTPRIVGPADAAITCVLLHGFGASGEDLVGLAQVLTAPVRFVFPAAPIALGGMYGDARAWWLLDLVRLQADMARGAPRDLRDEIPDGLAPARDQVSRLVDELAVRFGAAADRVVLGGFSQGAMLALDVALHRAAPPAGLLLMSGTLLAESLWRPRMPQLRGVPVLVAHGRSDTLLPFYAAELLRDQLTEAGAEVAWQPFSGGHEIPGAVLAAADRVLQRVAAR